MPDPPSEGPETDGDASSTLGELREAVRRASEALGRLRVQNRQWSEENERLRERVAELEENPVAGRDGTALLLDEDPEILRERIDHFIEALDAHLNEA